MLNCMAFLSQLSISFPEESGRFHICTTCSESHSEQASVNVLCSTHHGLDRVIRHMELVGLSEYAVLLQNLVTQCHSQPPPLEQTNLAASDSICMDLVQDSSWYSPVSDQVQMADKQDSHAATERNTSIGLELDHSSPSTALPPSLLGDALSSYSIFPSSSISPSFAHLSSPCVFTDGPQSADIEHSNFDPSDVDPFLLLEGEFQYSGNVSDPL